MRKSIPLLALLILGSAFFAPTSSAQNAAKWPLVNCATNTPCTANGPLNTHTGDSLPIAAYKLNTDIKQLALMFGSSSNLALNGSANASDIIGLWTNCTAGTPVLGYQGTCIAGGSGGSATFQANGTNLLSQSTINFLNSAATNGLTLSFTNPSAGEVQLGLSGILSVAGGGTGTATPSLVAGTNVTISGTWPDQTITASSTAATAFSAITAGTNTAALVMGSGGSLTASGGTIDATSVGGFTLPCTVPTLVSGDYLTNNGSTCSWAAVTGTGTMTDGSGTTVIGAIPYSSTTAHVYSLLPSPTSGAGYYTLQFDPTSTTAVAPTADQVGVHTRSISGSTTTDTVLYSDVLGLIVHDKAATGAVLETLPTPATLGNSNFGYTYCNDSAQTDTIQPTTYTIAVNGGTAGSSISVGTGVCAQISVDPFNSTQWDAFTYGASSGGSGQPQQLSTFTASGTWTPPSWAASDANSTTHVACLGGGGGASSGAVEPAGTASAGGSGGGGGSLNQATFLTSSLGSSVTVTVGTGGTGGNAQTATGNGLAGGGGGNTTFGTFLTAYGGTGGSFVGSASDGGTGAGLTGAVVKSVCVTPGGSAKGAPASCSGGGASGGGSSAGGASGAGGSSMLGGAGGGNGGGLAATPVSLAGGAGGSAGALAGPAGGAAAGAGSNGSVLATIFGGGTGGSGGGSNASGTGGAGGVGGLGAGGGGGGSSETTSGAGGNGGGGACYITTSY